MHGTFFFYFPGFPGFPVLVATLSEKQNTGDLIKKSHGISDLFIGCKHLTKITNKFYKIQLKQHGGQESAKLLQ